MDNAKDDSEDEVFFGAMSEKEEILYRRYRNRKTEQFFLGEWAQDKRSTPSEEYFGDVSSFGDELRAIAKSITKPDAGHGAAVDFSIPSEPRGKGDGASSSSANRETESSNFLPSPPFGKTPFLTDWQEWQKKGGTLSDAARKFRDTIFSFQHYSGNEFTPPDGRFLGELEKGPKCSLLGTPDPSEENASPLRLATEDSDSSIDSDVELGPEAFLMWNRKLMGMTAQPSPRVEQPKDVPKERQTSSPAVQQKRSSLWRLSARYSLHLATGPSMACSNPSPLVQALHLTPLKVAEPAKSSPLNLESLDLSVDERLPMDSYFEIMDKENENLEKRKKSSSKNAKPLGGSPLRDILNSPREPTRCQKVSTPKTVTKKPPSVKKTGIPVMESRLPFGSRHTRCFSVYSSNKLQELKAKSMKHWKHVDSPVAQYIQRDPVPLITNVRPKFTGLRGTYKAPTKTLFPLPQELSHLAEVPVARYTVKGMTPGPVASIAKHRYFPSPVTPLVVKHTGPDHIIDASCLHEESVLSSGNRVSQIPKLREGAAFRDESFWEIVLPKK